MSLKEIKDKLEIGLKPDAPYRPNNLPDAEQAEKQDELVDEFSSTADDTPDPARPVPPPAKPRA
jgi:hypothetical protein